MEKNKNIAVIIFAFILGGLFVYFLTNSGGIKDGVANSISELGILKPCIRTGCGGTICASGPKKNKGICDYAMRPSNYCYQEAECERQWYGLCGWSKKAELNACLDAALY